MAAAIKPDESRATHLLGPPLPSSSREFLTLKSYHPLLLWLPPPPSSANPFPLREGGTKLGRFLDALSRTIDILHLRMIGYCLVKSDKVRVLRGRSERRMRKCISKNGSSEEVGKRNAVRHGKCLHRKAALTALSEHTSCSVNVWCI